MLVCVSSVFIPVFAPGEIMLPASVVLTVSGLLSFFFPSLEIASGISIATAINSWFRNVDWEGLGEYLANKLNFLGDILYGFATTIDWQQIKDSINRALTSLWEKLDVEKIKTAIGKLAENFVDFIESVD